MTFKTNRRDNFYEVFLNDEHFAEVGTYNPAVGASLTIHALVRERQKEFEDQQVTRDDEEIYLTIGRDPTHEKGGVERPQVGDTYQRELYDGLGPFVFDGEIYSQTPHSWCLVMVRPKTRAAGTRHRRS